MQGLASVLAGMPLAALLIGPDARIAAQTSRNPARKRRMFCW